MLAVGKISEQVGLGSVSQLQDVACADGGRPCADCLGETVLLHLGVALCFFFYR